MVYIEKENGGLSDARNYGMPYAKGEYIAFLDSDDYIRVKTYQLMYEKAEKEDRKAEENLKIQLFKNFRTTKSIFKTNTRRT